MTNIDLLSNPDIYSAYNNYDLGGRTIAGITVPNSGGFQDLELGFEEDSFVSSSLSPSEIFMVYSSYNT